MVRTPALAVCFALLVAACGTGTEASDPPSPTTTTATPTTSSPPAGASVPASTTATLPPPGATELSAIDVVGLVPLPGGQLDFNANPVATPSLVWSLYTRSAGIIVENVGGPLPPGCHGTSLFDPDTFDLKQVGAGEAEAYASRGDGGCDGMQREVADGVVDGPVVKINTDDVIVFDFGELPAPPFDVSNQVLDPDGLNGLFREADPSPVLPYADLGSPDLKYVVGARVLFEIAGDGELSVLETPRPEPGDCAGFTICFYGRFGVTVVNSDGESATELALSDRAGLFDFADSGRLQALVRIVNGCQINGHFWIFATAAADEDFDLTVTDTTTGASRSYEYLQSFDPILDIAGFSSCP